MKIKTIIPISIIALFSLFGIGVSSCGLEYTSPTPSWKNDTILPAITSTGANTFGCRVNGIFWLAVPTKKISGSYSRGAISIVMDMSGDYQSSSILLTSSYNSILQPGIYHYTKDISGIYTDKNNYYTTNDDSNNIGFINIIRLDSKNRILSGNFEFRPYSGPKSVNITSGRFDFKY